MTSSDPTRGRLGIRLGWLLLAAIVLVLAGVFLHRRTIEADGWREGDAASLRELEAVLAETDAADPRWRWDDIEADRPKVPGEENSGSVLSALQPALRRQLAVTASRSFPPTDYPANRLLDDGELAWLDCVLDEGDGLVAQAISLKDRPRGRYAIQLASDPISTLLPHLDPLREVAFLLTVASERRLHEGQARAAAETIRATLNAGAGLRGEGFAITSLVRMALRSIAVGRVERLLGMSEPDADTLVRLLDHLTDETKENPAFDGLRGERAGTHRMFENWRKGIVPSCVDTDLLRGSRGLDWSELLRRNPGRSDLPAEHAEYLRWMNRAVAIAGRPPVEQPREWSHFRGEWIDGLRSLHKRPRGWLSWQFLDGTSRIGTAGVRDRAILDCTRAALAAECFRRGNQRWPASLAELVPVYLPAVPTDPFSGKEMIYKRTEDGVVIYSVSGDGVDDGGVRIALKDFREPGTDLGVRLWDPTHRRLPPEE